jgi:hypothetical protein
MSSPGSFCTSVLGHDAWVPHVCVDALERTIEAATALGATLLDVTNVPGVGSMTAMPR